MKKLLLIPLFLFCISAFGQFTKPQLYTGINTNIRLKTASQSRLAAMLDSLVASMELVGGGTLTNGSGTTANGMAADLGGTLSSSPSFNMGSAYNVEFYGTNGSKTQSLLWGYNGTQFNFDSNLDDGAGKTTRVYQLPAEITLQAASGANTYAININGANGLSFDFPTNATGDTYHRGSSTYFTRLPIGSLGDVYTVGASGEPEWAAPSGGGWATTGTTTLTGDVLIDGVAGPYNVTLGGSGTELNNFNVSTLTGFNIGTVSGSSISGGATTNLYLSATGTLRIGDNGGPFIDLDGTSGQFAHNGTGSNPGLSFPKGSFVNTSNQLTLGSTRTVTITAPTPATTSRTWTIPDNSADQTFAAKQDLRGWLTGTLTGAVDIVGSSSNTLTHTFNSLGTTQTDGAGLHFRNTTAAAAGAQQRSPSIVWEAQGWKTNATAASQSVKFLADVLPVQGTANPSGTWALFSSINAGAYTSRLSVTSAGLLTVGDLTLTAGTLTLSSSRNLSFSGGLGSIRTDANAGLEFRANSTSTVVTGGQYRFYNINNYTATSGTQNVIANETGFAPTSGTAVFNAYLGSGTINQTGGANGRVTFHKLNPTFTAAADVVGYDYAPASGTPTAELSYRATQGKVLFGGSTITASTYHDFRGGSSTDKILRLADGSNNELFTFKADKEYEVTQTNGKYQERQPTGTTSATVFAETIYSSTDISDGQSVTIEVLWTAKDSGANTGAGGVFYTTWTKASGTLAKVGDNQLVTNDNMTGSWALSTSDSSGSISLTFTGSGVANTEISLVTRIIKSN